MTEQYQLFRAHRSKFLEQMSPILDFLPYDSICYNPYPLVLGHRLCEEFTEFMDVLVRGVNAVVRSYLEDSRIHAMMPISPELKKILEMCSGQPYQLGTIRPDILFQKGGGVKICEINARFPLNGMTISQWLSKSTAGSPYLMWNGYEPNEGVMDILNSLENRFDLNKPLLRVSKSEKGGESRYFLEHFKSLGGEVIHASPEQLEAVPTGVSANGQSVDQFILEMDRQELLLLDGRVLRLIIQSGNYLNDIRTLILVHDKRLLGVLGNRQVMKDYLPDADLDILSKYIPETVDLSLEENFKRVLDDRKKWVIKKISGGRGVGLLMGCDCDKARWYSTLLEHRSEYMAQAYVEPEKFLITYEKGNEIVQNHLHIVGSLPCLDGHYFGPGMFRASEQEGINIGEGEGESIFLGTAQQLPISGYEPSDDRQPEVWQVQA